MITLRNLVPLKYDQARWSEVVNRIELAFNALAGGRLSERVSAAAAPTTGTWARGDIVYNNAPSAAGTIGWVCVAAGTPGTWKAWGTIAS